MTEEIRVMIPDDERRGHKPRKTGSHWGLKRQGSASSPRASCRNQPYQYFACSPVKMTLDFGTSQLQYISIALSH